MIVLTSEQAAKYRNYMNKHCSDSHSDYETTENLILDKHLYTIIQVKIGRFVDTIYIPIEQPPQPNDGYYVDWRSKGGCVWYYDVEHLKHMLQQ